MPRRSALIFVIWAIFVNYGHSYDPPGGNPDGVAPPLRPAHLKRIYNSSLVFESVVPTVHNRQATLAIKLACPCPAAYVHFGFPSTGTPVLPMYFYGTPARVLSPDDKGYGKEQEVRLNLQKLFLQQPLANHTVCFRIELYVPLHERTMCYDGRFTCHEVGGRVEILTMVEGPVIDCVTASSAVVSLDTDQITEARVYLTGDERVIKSLSPGTHHEIEVSGLSPNTAYHYRVVAEKDGVEVASPTLHFTTAPAGISSFRFAVMTDSRGSYGGADSKYLGVNFAMVRALFLDAHRRGASVVFFPGDLVDGFTNSTADMVQQFQGWRAAAEPVAQLIPIYEGMGNHEMCLDTYEDGSKYGLGFDKEGEESSESLFARSFVNPMNGPDPEREGLPPYRENVYFVDYGQIRFIMLNTNYWISTFPEKYGGNLEGYILPGQMEWLKKCLDDAAGNPGIRHVFIGTHEPVFPTNKHAKDGMWYNGGSAVDGKKRDYIIRCRDRLWKMLVDCPKVVAVICGDEHNYSRLLITGDTPVYGDGTANPEFRHPLCLIVTGGAGAPLYPFEVADVPWKNAIAQSCVAYHYVLFTVSPEEISLECVADNGSILDSYTIWRIQND